MMWTDYYFIFYFPAPACEHACLTFILCLPQNHCKRQVVGYNERGRVRVRFPKGTWNFLPAELRKEADKVSADMTQERA